MGVRFVEVERIVNGRPERMYVNPAQVVSITPEVTDDHARLDLVGWESFVTINMTMANLARWLEGGW